MLNVNIFQDIKIIFQGEVSAVKFRSSEGTNKIFIDYIPFMAVLYKGESLITLFDKDNNVINEYSINGGIVNVKNNNVTFSLRGE